MNDQSTNYDDVKQYRLDPERIQELIMSAGECVFIWANKAGHPIGVITAYVPVNGKIWMTATRERVRIKAIARDGRSSCVFTSKGTRGTPSFMKNRKRNCGFTSCLLEAWQGGQMMAMSLLKIWIRTCLLSFWTRQSESYSNLHQSLRFLLMVTRWRRVLQQPTPVLRKTRASHPHSLTEKSPRNLRWLPVACQPLPGSLPSCTRLWPSRCFQT